MGTGPYTTTQKSMGTGDIEMQIISGTTEFELDGECAVTIGKFDGVHRGHRELIDRILCKQNLKPVIFTFDKSPSEFFLNKSIPSLTTIEEKRRIFEYLGVDTLVEFPLNDVTAKTPPDLFIKDILVNKLHARYIVAGADASFGDKGKGDAKLIADMAEECGYEYEIIDKLVVDDEEVSSTIIRDYVSSGNMEKAAELIGVPYAIRGMVVRGNQIGRTIGFPTVNIEVTREKLMPPFGVYFTEISVGGKHYNGITNVGTKPTISSGDTVFAETHILDFNDDIYGENVTVKLLHFERDERKFADLDELKLQISRDLQSGINYFT